MLGIIGFNFVLVGMPSESELVGKHSQTFCFILQIGDKACMFRGVVWELMLQKYYFLQLEYLTKLFYLFVIRPHIINYLLVKWFLIWLAIDLLIKKEN